MGQVCISELSGQAQRSPLVERSPLVKLENCHHATGRIIHLMKLLHASLQNSDTSHKVMFQGSGLKVKVTIAINRKKQDTC